MTNAVTCHDVIESYLKLMSDDFEVAPSDSGCYVLTPFTRPDGEAIELELTSFPNGSIRLSDMGDTLGYLYVNGLNLTQTVLDKTRRIARRNRVSLHQGALVVEGDDVMQGDGLHRLIQAAVETTSLIQGRRSTSRVEFNTEVESFIIQSGVVYDVDFRVMGQRESHMFKFHVNSGRNLLVQPIAAASEPAAHSWAERWAYRFSDTIATRSDLRPIAVLDDRGNRRSVWTPKAQAPIQDTAILWENKHLLADRLGA